MKNIALWLLLLLCSGPAYAADTPISGLTPGGTVQTGDAIPVARGGQNYRVNVGPIAPLGIGNGLASSGGNLILNTAVPNTWTALQTFNAGDLTAASPTFTGTVAADSALLSGTVGIGTTSQTAGTVLDLGGSTNSLLLPAGTTGQRPSGVSGMLRYNSTTAAIEGFLNGVWKDVGVDPSSMDAMTSASGAQQGIIARASNGAYLLVTNLSQLCGTAFSGDTCTAMFGFADPRNYGAECSTNFTGNNNLHDDSAGIQAALANSANAPVLIPVPGCKISAGVKFLKQGNTLFSFPHSAPYDANNHAQNPYIFLPNTLQATTNNVGVDINGFGDNLFEHITFRCNFNQFGSVAVGNSYSSGGGIRSGTNFTSFEHFSVGNCGNGIGSPMDYGLGNSGPPYGTCTPTGTIGNNIIQMVGHDMKFQNNCYGMYDNFGDTWIDVLIGGSNKGPLFSTIPGNASWVSLNNVRNDYSGYEVDGTSGSLQQGGSGIFLDSPLGGQVVNYTSDHSQGPCLTLGQNAKHYSIVNARCNVSGAGSFGAPYDTHFLVYGGAQNNKDSAFINVDTSYNIGLPAHSTPYVLTTVGSPDYIRWSANSGLSGGSDGGYATSYLNLANAMPHLQFFAPGTTTLLGSDPVVVGGANSATAGAILDLSSATNSLLLPKGTTGQRPGAGVNGMLRYNSTLNQVEGYINGLWGQIGGVSGIITLAQGGTNSAIGSAYQLFGGASRPNSQDAFGDSITAMSDTGGATTRYVQQIEVDTHSVLANNSAGHGSSGAMACDVSDIQIIGNGINPAPNKSSYYTMMIGTNEANSKGAGSYEAGVYKPCHQAALAWLAIPSSYKVLNTSCSVSGFGNTDGASPFNFKYATNSGDTMDCTITTYGGPLYITYRTADGSSGTFTYAVDGGTASSNIATAPTPAIATQTGGTHGEGLIRVTGLSAGSHTVHFVATSSGTVEPIAVSTVPPYPEWQAPAVYSADVPYQSGDTLSSATAAYSADAVADQALLWGDGLRVFPVTTRNYLSSSAGNFANTLHPNNTGQALLTRAFEASMQPSGHVAYVDTTNNNLVVGPSNFGITVSQSGGGSNGKENAGVGVNALNANTTGALNTAIGFNALSANTTGINNVVVGAESMTGGTGSSNSVVGTSAMQANTSGNNNSAFGYNALLRNTTGSANTAVGYQALLNNTTGIANTAIGRIALGSVTTGTNNTAVGYKCGSTTLSTGSRNLLFGTDVNCDTPAAGTNDYFQVSASSGTTPLLSGNLASGSLALAIGTTAQTTGAVLDMGSNTNSVLLPIGTTGQRPTGANGMLRYNSTVPQVEAFVNGTWTQLGTNSTTNNNFQQVLKPSSAVPDSTGNIFPYDYVGAGGNVSADDYMWGVAASLAADSTIKLRFDMPSTIPSSGTFKLVSLCLANASAGVVKYTVSDADVATNDTVSPSAATLTAETQTSITWDHADFYVRTATALTSTPAANHVSVVAIKFQTSGWTLGSVLACRFFESWE